MVNINNDIKLIDERLKSHVITYLISNLLSSIMGEGAETEDAILEVLSDDYAYENMRNLIPNFDREFITNMIVALAGTRVTDEMKKIGLSGEALETEVISRLKAKLTERG